MARYFHTIDAKGRVIVPSRLRNNLEDTVLHIGESLDAGVLSVYNKERFETIKNQINQLNTADPAVRKLRRIVLGSSEVCEIDKQGRVSISADLWKSIGVVAGDDIVFIDMFDVIEIVSKKTYDATEADSTSISELDLARFNVTGL